jgi:hypothetical protein
LLIALRTVASTASRDTVPLPVAEVEAIALSAAAAAAGADAATAGLLDIPAAKRL